MIKILINIILCQILILSNVKCVAMAGQKIVFFYAIEDQTEGNGIDPVEKIVYLIKSNPRARYIRFSLKITSMSADYDNNVLFDRKMKTITFHSVSSINSNRKKYYYRFYRVDGSLLQKWVIASNRQDNTFGRDMDLFLLADIGSPLKNLRTGKLVSNLDEIPELN